MTGRNRNPNVHSLVLRLFLDRDRGADAFVKDVVEWSLKAT